MNYQLSKLKIMENIDSTKLIISCILVFIWLSILVYYLFKIFKDYGKPLAKSAKKIISKEIFGYTYPESIEVKDEENLSTEHQSILNIIYSQSTTAHKCAFQEIADIALINNIPENGKPNLNFLKEGWGLFNKPIPAEKAEIFSNAFDSLPILIEIAEMYHDYLISQKQTEGLPFKIVQETLNKISYGNTNQKN